MAWTFVIFAVLLFCTPGHAQLWSECRDSSLMKANFYDCQCGYDKNTGELSALQCVDTGYIDSSVITKIPFEGLTDTLCNVTFTGNNFQELPRNIFGDCSKASGKTFAHSYLGLEYLDLSNNNINVIHGKTFHCIQNLKALILNDNNLDHPGNSPRMFSDLEFLEVLHLRNAFNFDKQGTGDDTIVSMAAIIQGSDLQSLLELNLASNHIGSFSAKLFEKLQNLEKLDLSDNYLTNPVFSSECVSNVGLGCSLKELYLNSNSISQLSAEFMRNMDEHLRLEKLDLSDNPFWCDCSFKNTYTWLKSQKSHLVNSFRLLCKGPPKVAGVNVLSLNASDLEDCVSEADFTATEEKGSGHSAGNVILVILLVAVSCLIIGVVFLKRRTIKDSVKSRLGAYFPRLFATGYNTVSNPASTV